MKSFLRTYKDEKTKFSNLVQKLRRSLHLNPFTPGILKWTNPAFNLANSIYQKKGVSQTTQAKWQTA